MSGSELIDLVRLAGGHERGRGYALVFICYLDDSDSEHSSVLTLAGYVAPLSTWQQFETKADDACGNYNVPIFHAHEFHRTRDEYKGWSSIKKASFIDEFYAVPPSMGISISIRKKGYKDRQTETGLNKSMSAYGVAFASIAASLVTNFSISEQIREQGVSFIVEAGHNNNAEIEKYFNKFKHHEFFEGVLRSITFSGKEESRAIQLADLYVRLANNDQ